MIKFRIFISQKLRKIIVQILFKVCTHSDKMKTHVQSTMEACLKVIEHDNEQCAVYCILVFKELLNFTKPSFDGCLKAEVC